VNVEDYRQRLLVIAAELERRLGREIDTARTTADDQADAGDQAVVDELKDEYFGLATNDSAILAEVRAALQRIDEGTYGRCVADGRSIPEKRLQATPWTRYCVEHQQELEERRGLRTPTL
jgi:DnaK suppressor protein